MKQRILALFLALCLCLPLAACGKKQGYDPLEGRLRLLCLREKMHP